MARKRRVFFRDLQSFLKSRHSSKGRITLTYLLVWFLLAVFTAYLCIVAPATARVPLVNPIVQSLSASQLVNRGREFYTNRQFDRALADWLQAEQTYKNTGDVLHQAIAWSYICLTYQQLEKWSEAEAAIKTSINLLNTEQSIGNSPERSLILAQTLNTRGRLEFALGQSDAALVTWQQATATYRQVNDTTGITGSLINQAQAMEGLGLHRKACKTLLQALELKEQNCENADQLLLLIQRQPDSPIKAVGLRSLGNVLRVVDNLEQSQQVLAASLAVAQKLRSPQDESASLLSLGNTVQALGNRERILQNARSEQKFVSLNDAVSCTNKSNNITTFEFYQQAAKCYQQAADISNAPPIAKIQAQLNYLKVLVETEEWLRFSNQRQALQDIQQQIHSQVTNLAKLQSQLLNLPASQAVVYAKINLAESLQRLVQNSDIGKPEWFKQIEALLNTAIQQAKQIKDKRAAAYALGTLGRFYEQTQRLPLAQEMTQQALELAQSTQAWDIAYQWQWQLGRILKTGKDITGAIAAYEAAVESLKFVRQDLIAVNPDVQFSFQDSVAPVYRQFVDLLLPAAGIMPNQANLQRARQVIASLQVAELENFLKCNLENEQRVPIDRVADQYNAAIIYPIILAERLAVIVKLPSSGELLYYETPVKQSDVESKLEKLRIELEKPYISANGKRWSQEVYDWLIRPAAKLLDAEKVSTLVFVPDNRLRNIPMAALRDRDRQQYLIEKYAVALNLGLELQNPQPLRQQRLEALTAGITTELRGFEQLKYVGLELELINKLIPSKKLLNQEFSSRNLQSQLSSRPFSVVHLATHGKFSSQLDQTSIQAWDAPITINELSNIFQTQSQTRPEPIELLVLGACQTATGDERSVLGLAGVAVQSGARSTLASLWYLNDQSSALLMNEFYRYLKDPKIPNKAEALRRAQQQMMQNTNYDYVAPAYWAAYILVGNWL